MLHACVRVFQRKVLLLYLCVCLTLSPLIPFAPFVCIDRISDADTPRLRVITVTIYANEISESHFDAY